MSNPRNKQDVVMRLDDIRNQTGFDGSGHVAQDSLWYDLLESIAEGLCDDPAGCAALAITTFQMDFPVWFE